LTAGDTAMKLARIEEGALPAVNHLRDEVGYALDKLERGRRCDYARHDQSRIIATGRSDAMLLAEGFLPVRLPAKAAPWCLNLTQTSWADDVRNHAGFTQGPAMSGWAWFAIDHCEVQGQS
jgi:hypothetical protein